MKHSGRCRDVTGMVTQAQPALTGNWWPSKYGPEDQAGALNEITPGKVLEAVREVITVADAENALASTGHDLRPGDAVFFHTGWGSLWGIDNERYAAGEPGPGRALGQWLADHQVALTGCDTWSFGPYPAEDAKEPFVVPQTLNVRHGIVVVENLRLDEIALAHVHEYLLVIAGEHRQPAVAGVTSHA